MIDYIRPVIHYFLHFGFPLILSTLLFRKEWKKAYFIMIGTMLVDVDHLLSNPIFAPDRCSINFHPLHTFWAIGIYFLLLFFKGNLRIIGVGLLFHMLTDWIDCQLNSAA